MSALDFAVLCLATFRIALFLLEDDLIDAPRARFHATHPEGTFLGEVSRCRFCLTFWVALGLWILTLTPVAPVLYPLGAWGGAVILYGLCERVNA